MLAAQCYEPINVWIGYLKTGAGQEISQENDRWSSQAGSLAPFAFKSPLQTKWMIENNWKSQIFAVLFCVKDYNKQIKIKEITLK